MSISQMKKFKEWQELRDWYWKQHCQELYNEAEMTKKQMAYLAIFCTMTLSLTIYLYLAYRALLFESEYLVFFNYLMFVVAFAKIGIILSCIMGLLHNWMDAK